MSEPVQLLPKSERAWLIQVSRWRDSLGRSSVRHEPMRMQATDKPYLSAYMRPNASPNTLDTP